MDLAADALREYLDVKHVLLTCNGTVANHLMAKCLRLRTTHRQIVVPSNAYVAAWNPFLYDRFFELVPIDMDINTWNMQTHDILGRAENLLVVHNLGNIVNVPVLKELYPNLNIVEDACEAFGGYYTNDNYYICAGTESLCSTFSFYGNKNITSGEGGAFVTNDDELYEYARLIWGQGQSAEKFVHTELGYNYRMTNVQAAILYGQLQEWDYIEDRKISIWSKYYGQIRNMVGAIMQLDEDGTSHSNWMFGVRLEGNKSYKDAESFFKSFGIETRPFFYTINKHKHLRSHVRKYPVGEILESEVVIFPSYPELTSNQIEYICRRIKEYVSFINSVR